MYFNNLDSSSTMWLDLGSWILMSNSTAPHYSVKQSESVSDYSRNTAVTHTLPAHEHAYTIVVSLC